MSPRSPPVVLVAFANDRVDHKRYLRNLPLEQKCIRAALEKTEKQPCCELVERPNATFDEIFRAFQEHGDRVSVFHFAGHAGSAELFFESVKGASTKVHAGGFGKFLGQQGGLQLVFLNGCSSKGQVKGLLDAGVPSVIATSQAIDDEVATEFSARFYQAFGSGDDVRTAFCEAEAAVQCMKRHPRDTYGANPQRRPAHIGDDDWPWKLYPDVGAESHSFRLGAAGGGTEVPPLLPFMPNRSKQKNRLDEDLRRHRTERPRRPFVTLVYGDASEHVAFVRRLEEDTFPKLLGLRGDSKVDDKPLEWVEPGGCTLVERQRLLKRNLGEVITGDRDADWDAMASAIAEHRCPVMISTKIYSEFWQPDESKLLREWLDLWGQVWPDLPPNHSLLIVMSFVLEDVSQESIWDRLTKKKRKRNREVRGFVESLSRLDFDGITVAALPELEGIGEEHVREWIDNCCRGVRGLPEEYVLAQKLGPEIKDLFRDSKGRTESGGIPMELLAGKLKDWLERCMAEEG